ncbi:acyl-CoA dehydratase activase [Tepidibacter sp. Z1-5]|uniref:acyl-CoA dehydratase activase n=1 Tax=Tepidibacter sp. Z1-5 TaxID=3134138 RepID=UPI0030C47D40
MSKYFCGCDVGSTYGKCVILDEKGKLISSAIVRSKIDPEETSKETIRQALENCNGIDSVEDFNYLVGTGYGRNKVPFADENVSEISCHAMGVHVTNPKIKTIIDIGGQDVKGISVDTDGTVRNFAMNDKCAAGTGRFFESMANAFELSLDEFSKLSLTTDKVIPITAQCSVFAESEVISLVGEKKPKNEIAAGIQVSVAKRCFVMCKKAGMEPEFTLTGGCAKNIGLKKAIEKVLKIKITDLTTDPQLMGALGAAEYARQKGLAQGK